MDDLELEARLRTHLHRRFDDPPMPMSLASNVSQALATATHPVGFATRVGSIRLGWATLAAAVVIAVTAIAIGTGVGIGPAGPDSTATPAPTLAVAPTRVFVVLPPGGTIVAKPETSLALEVMNARLRALGIGNFESAAGDGLEFFLPTDGPSDGSIRAVLAATGDVQIVPLPSTDYGDGKLTATIGVVLPKAEPALFGWEGIASVVSDPLAGAPDLTITLRPNAAQAFGDYTTAHVGETFAIVVDGRLSLLPVVQEPIMIGRIVVSAGSSGAFTDAAAILAGGMLPEAWRGASVPVIVSRDQAIAAALAVTHGGTVPTVDLVLGGRPNVVWSIGVHQPDCFDTQSCVSADLQIEVDAVTGTVISVRPRPS